MGTTLVGNDLFPAARNCGEERMMDEPGTLRPLLHIGYHKTGSTWLQESLFDNAEVGLASPCQWSEVREVLVKPHPLDFDRQACVDRCYPAMRAAQDQGLVPVLSSEGLAGDPHHNAYKSKEWADRLAQVFPDGKVLIVIREQKSIILSFYKHDITAGGGYSLADYLCPPRVRVGRAPYDTTPFAFEHFAYHRLIGYYISLFGRANVLVLPFESFKNQPHDFVGEIVRFSGAGGVEMVAGLPYSKQVNKSLSGFGVALKHRLNAVAPWDRRHPRRNLQWPLHHLVGKLDSVAPRSWRAAADEKLKVSIAAAVGDSYRQSNRRTAELLGLNLAQYGYDL